MNRFIKLFFCLSIISSQLLWAWDAKHFKKPTDAQLKKKLSALQYDVTQKSATEKPFANEYNNEKREGIYVDIVSGEPLFSSKDKFDSGTGWPSFTRPLVPANIVEKEDGSLLEKRTEIRSKHADSHLGHVFLDGPPPTGLRYCMNSSALKLVPKEDLKAKGYGEFIAHFEGSSQGSKAVFAAGCFWCIEPPFDKAKGVISTRVGFTGGKIAHPTYEAVSSGSTGHYEAIEVTFDPSQTSYAELLNVFWHNVDPFDDSGQFCDKGQQYTSAIFYLDSEQEKSAKRSLAIPQKIARKGIVVATKIIPAAEFYPAEEYHQDFYKKDPAKYKSYRYGCGRDRRLEELWGKP